MQNVMQALYLTRNARGLPASARRYTYLYYGETSLKERICFASNWGTQSMPVEKLIAQVEALPFSDDAKEHILYNNAKTFYEQL